MRARFALYNAVGWIAAMAFVAMFVVPQAGHATVPHVLTVPWDSANDPHTTYANGGIESVITLQATAPNLVGDADTYQVTWHFGDGSPDTVFTMTDPYNLSTTHQYPSAAAVGTTWTATVTVLDTTNGTDTGSNTYPVIQTAFSQNAQVNVAIDNGLWALHVGEFRCNAGVGWVLGMKEVNGCHTGGVFGGGNYGGWEYYSGISGNPYTPLLYTGCIGITAYVGCNVSYGSINASNVQAFEVKGHLASGPPSDPYTEDVQRGLAHVIMFLVPEPVQMYSYHYNIPGTACPNGATTACTGVFDSNSNGQALYFEGDNRGEQGYQGGQAMDALVASGASGATANTGPGSPGGLGADGFVPPGVTGQTYKDLVADLGDGYEYCQNETAAGGGWAYDCFQVGSAYTYAPYNDNSVSQWAAIGLLAAARGFGIGIPQIVLDADNVWLTSDEDPATPTYPSNCVGYGVDSCGGSFGYNGRTSFPWGPFADTPSGLVQMDMLDVNGGSFGRSDSRWQQAETYYRDNFCNNPAGGATQAPRAYTYGLFSFTKSMLEYAPGGTLAPLALLQDDLASGSGFSPIDWYGAQASGGAQCDGVAQTLVNTQVQYSSGTTPANGTEAGAVPFGYWYGHNYYSLQYYYETAWDIIMLNKSVFAACVSNLSGQGTPKSALKPARIDLTWSPQSGAVSYDVLISTTNGGPYTKVGNTTHTVFTDTSGLVNGDTYYFVLNPLNGAGQGICQSNQATITVP